MLFHNALVSDGTVTLFEFSPGINGVTNALTFIPILKNGFYKLKCITFCYPNNIFVQSSVIYYHFKHVGNPNIYENLG